MGEKSKEIGERGEKIVNNFLEKIGWKPIQKGVSIICLKQDFHDSTTHGIDYFFSYKCPLKTRTLENLIISVKFSEDPYPISEKTGFKGLKTVFREHFEDLVDTIECYKKSNFKSSNNRQQIGINKANDTGVLFWLTDELGDQNIDIIELVKTSQIDSKLNFDVVYLVDNNRVNFILDSLKFAQSAFDNVVRVTFDYISTGSNVDITERKTNGTVLPIQYINSPLLPIRLELKNGEKIFMLSSIDNYSHEDLKRLIGLTQNYVLSYQMKTIICFPDFNPNRDNENTINEIKASFNNSIFTDTISVKNYRPNLINI